MKKAMFLLVTAFIFASVGSADTVNIWTLVAAILAVLGIRESLKLDK